MARKSEDLGSERATVAARGDTHDQGDTLQEPGIPSPYVVVERDDEITTTSEGQGTGDGTNDERLGVGGVDPVNGFSDDDILSPDELVGQERELYKVKAFDLFQAASDGLGRVKVSQLPPIAKKLRLGDVNISTLAPLVGPMVTNQQRRKPAEGSSMSGSGAGGEKEKPEGQDTTQPVVEPSVSFAEMVQLFDLLSKTRRQSAIGDWNGTSAGTGLGGGDRDANGGVVAAAGESLGDIRLVSPAEYLYYSLPCVQKPEKVTFRLDTKVEFTPKRQLLCTTTLLMITSCFLLLTIVGVLWDRNRDSNELAQMSDLRTTVDQLSNLYEQIFVQESADEIFTQTEDIAALMDLLFQKSRSRLSARQQRLLRQVQRGVDLPIVSVNAERFAVLQQFIKANVSFNLTLLEPHLKNDLFASVAVPNNTQRVTPSPSPTGNTSNATKSQPTSTPSPFAVSTQIQTLLQVVTQCPQGSLLTFNNDSSLTVCVQINDTQYQQRKLDAFQEAVDSLGSLLNLSSSPNAPRFFAAQLVNLSEYSANLPNTLFNDTARGILVQPLSENLKASCLDPDGKPLCLALLSQLSNDVYRSITDASVGLTPQRVWASGRIVGIGNETGVVGYSLTKAAPSLRPSSTGKASSWNDGLVLITQTDYKAFLARFQNATIDAVEVINSKYNRSTKLTIGRVNASTGLFETQVSRPRPSDRCFTSDCKRPSAAERSSIAAFTSKSAAVSMGPDYRPEPCISAAHWTRNLETVLLVEQDVVEVHKAGLAALVDAMNKMNAALSLSTEIEVFRFNSAPPIMTFDPTTPCLPTEDCLVSNDTQIGVYFHWNCMFCQRALPPSSNEGIVKLTANKKLLPATTATTGGTVQQAQLADIYGQTLRQRKRLQGFVKDYAEDEVYIVTTFVSNYSIGLAVKTDVADLLGESRYWLWVSVGVGVSILAVGLAFLLLVSNNALTAIERDWTESKAKIERDRAKFADLVSDLIPPIAVMKMMVKGFKSLVEPQTVATVVFADMCNFTEWTRHYSPKQTVRLASYAFLVLEQIGHAVGMSRLGSMGDAFVTYAFQPTAAEDRKNPMQHSAVRGARYAVLAAQIFSARFSHFPERNRSYREAFKDRFKSETPFLMPPLRFGGHCGMLTSLYLDISHVPRFDCFGQAPALAARMVATAAPSTIHVTYLMRDSILTALPQQTSHAASGSKTSPTLPPHQRSIRGSVNPESWHGKDDATGTSDMRRLEQPSEDIQPSSNSYNAAGGTNDPGLRIKDRSTVSFGEPRKTIVRNQGTITSYFITASTFDVPQTLLAQLGIQRARLSFDFARAFTNTSKASSHSRSQKSSSKGPQSQSAGEDQSRKSHSTATSKATPLA
jgi:class 3 adenylate cyclase